MIGNAPHSYITGVPGWETPAEQELLVELAKAVPNKGKIIEIGSEYGMSASLFCKAALPDVVIVCIDLFPGDLMQVHQQNLTEAGFNNRQIVYYQEDSHGPNAYKGLKAPPGTDLLFIDGDHTYMGCKADIEIWTPFVKPGGRVAFHDTACATNLNPHPLHHEVSRAINDWLAEDGDHWQFLESVDSIMVFERTA